MIFLGSKEFIVANTTGNGIEHNLSKIEEWSQAPASRCLMTDLEFRTDEIKLTLEDPSRVLL